MSKSISDVQKMLDLVYKDKQLTEVGHNSQQGNGMNGGMCSMSNNQLKNGNQQLGCTAACAANKSFHQNPTFGLRFNPMHT